MYLLLQTLFADAGYQGRQLRGLTARRDRDNPPPGTTNGSVRCAKGRGTFCSGRRRSWAVPIVRAKTFLDLDVKQLTRPKTPPR
jgi:hypothetical protein